MGKTGLGHREKGVGRTIGKSLYYDFLGKEKVRHSKQA